jgi:DNA (cytosine-5)-methyltransferase 1
MRSIKFDLIERKAIGAGAASNDGAYASIRGDKQSPFNDRGVVSTPRLCLMRPVGPKDQIEFTVKAHPLPDGQWIAEPSWHCNASNTPGNCQQPSEHSTPFRSRSEAVDDAISRGMRQIGSELGASGSESGWVKRIEALRQWAVGALKEVRANDETLPLRGVSVVDLACGGLGGFGMALTSLGAHVKLACDIDPQARDIYQRNIHPESMHSDLCTLNGREIECDILTMGLMCQAFSKAGHGLGMEDPKLATAYKHSMRLLAEVDAKVIVIECVRQLLTANDGRDAALVRRTLLEAGYRVQHRTLNTKGFGLPQSRERVFIVATRIGLRTDDLVGYVFPAEQAPSTVVADIMDSNINSDVPASRIVVRKNAPTTRQAAMVEIGRIDGRNSQGYRVYSPMGLGATLTANSGGRGQTSTYYINGDARTLTSREACRMQGLPDWAVHHSNTRQARKHAGNAVGIPLVRELMRPLASALASNQDTFFTMEMEGVAA